MQRLFSKRSCCRWSYTYGFGAVLAVAGNRFASITNGGDDAKKMDQAGFEQGIYNGIGAGFAAFTAVVALTAVPEGFKMIMSSQELSKEFAFLLGCGFVVTGFVQCIKGMRMFDEAKGPAPAPAA